MRVPPTPPSMGMVLAAHGPDALMLAHRNAQEVSDYPHWDKLRRRPTPDGLTSELWWAGIKLTRNYIQLPLVDSAGQPFVYTMPSQVHEQLHKLSVATAGTLGGLGERVVNDASQRRYLMSSLRDEAISSSLLEGAATTRRVANEMLRTRRPPRTPGERMIANNYAAMQWIRDNVDSPLTPDGVRELHTILTRSTVDEGDDGRLQVSGEERVVVSTPDGVVLHTPPPADELVQRLEALCDFANGVSGPREWLHPLARAIIVHFMAGYDHYFVDGNGRTARALFYWVALREGHWLAEYLSLSRILTEAPVQYGRAYLEVETDDGDVTYFLIHQLGVLARALEHLTTYLDRKQVELAQTGHLARGLGLNHRQQAVVTGAVQTPGLKVTAASHAASHDVTVQTARADLNSLADLGLFTMAKQGRQMVWTAVDDLTRRVQTLHEV